MAKRRIPVRDWIRFDAIITGGERGTRAVDVFAESHGEARKRITETLEPNEYIHTLEIRRR